LSPCLSVAQTLEALRFFPVRCGEGFVHFGELAETSPPQKAPHPQLVVFPLAAGLLYRLGVPVMHRLSIS
jgi:hypothetical protein